MDGVSEDRLHPAVARVVRDHGAEGVLDLLGEGLSGADLTAVLLEVMRRRAAAATPAQVLAAYERDRFVRPAVVDARRLLAIEVAALDAVDPPFEPVVTSPLVPLGTHAAVAGVHQNRVVTTVRRSEVAADVTNSLALEAAARRRRLLADDRRSSTVVHLAAVDRIVRAQRFDGPRSFAHFALLGLVSAGRDTGDRAFERTAMAEHLQAVTRIAERLGLTPARLELTDFGGRHQDVLDALAASVASPSVEVTLRPDRTAARGYYPNVCFKVCVSCDGEELEAGDGGVVPWTQSLVGSGKERLMISGLSLERLALVTPSPGRGEG